MYYDDDSGAVVGTIIGEMVNRYGNLIEVEVVVVDDGNGYRRYYVDDREVYFDEVSQIWRFFDDYEDEEEEDLDEEY
jgi:hypothetical protein